MQLHMFKIYKFGHVPCLTVIFHTLCFIIWVWRVANIFACNICRGILFRKINECCARSQRWDLLWRVCLSMSDNWFRKWLGTENRRHSYVNPWWARSLPHICVISLQFPNTVWERIQITLHTVSSCAEINRSRWNSTEMLPQAFYNFPEIAS